MKETRSPSIPKNVKIGHALLGLLSLSFWVVHDLFQWASNSLVGRLRKNFKGLNHEAASNFAMSKGARLYIPGE